MKEDFDTINKDLKHDNILVAKDGRLKLTDFGLSHLGAVGRQLALSDDIEQSKSLVGTPDYVAPEIVMCRPHSFAVDYWSLGAIVYELLCGIPPFHGETELETHANIIRGKYSPIEDVSPEAMDFVTKLLNPNPKKRLGANGSLEVLNHPWLKGLSIDQVEPPFVPELQSVYDTEYFEERKPLTETDDNSDILADIKAANAAQSEDTRGLTAVSVEQLGTSNTRAAMKIRRGRVYSTRVSNMQSTPNVKLQFSLAKESLPLFENSPPLTGEKNSQPEKEKLPSATMNVIPAMRQSHLRRQSEHIVIPRSSVRASDDFSIKRFGNGQRRQSDVV